MFQVRCLWDIVTLWNMRCNVDILEETGELPIKRSTEEIPGVQIPAEDARPLPTEATATVQTEKKEEEARRDLFAVGGCHQQRPN